MNSNAICVKACVYQISLKVFEDICQNKQEIVGKSETAKKRKNSWNWCLWLIISII